MQNSGTNVIALTSHVESNTFYFPSLSMPVLLYLPPQFSCFRVTTCFSCHCSFLHLSCTKASCDCHWKKQSHTGFGCWLWPALPLPRAIKISVTAQQIGPGRWAGLQRWHCLHCSQGAWPHFVLLVASQKDNWTQCCVRSTTRPA